MGGSLAIQFRGKRRINLELLPAAAHNTARRETARGVTDSRLLALHSGIPGPSGPGVAGVALVIDATAWRTATWLNPKVTTNQLAGNRRSASAQPTVARHYLPAFTFLVGVDVRLNAVAH